MLKSGMVLESGSGTEKKKKQGLQSGQVLGDVTVTDSFNPYKTQTAENVLSDIFNNPNKVLKQTATGNQIPHVNPTAKKQKNLLKDAVLNSAKKAIVDGRDFTTDEIKTIKKYGFSSVVPNSGTVEYDMFAQNNPLNKARFERVKKIVSKQGRGEKLTKDEENTLETFKLINNYRSNDIKDKGIMTADTTDNAYKMQDIKAKKLYNDAAYGSDKIKIGNKEFEVKKSDTTAKALRKVQNENKKTDLYINAGLEQYAEGINTTADAIKDLALSFIGDYNIEGINKSDKAKALEAANFKIKSRRI